MNMGSEYPKESEGIDKHVLREASDFGCFGLIRGEAIQIRTGNRVSAQASERSDGPFLCPQCRNPAIVHKDRGGGRIEHFAHNAPHTPLLPHTETVLHKAAKNEIRDLLHASWPEGDWRVERPIKKNEKKKIPALQPDISGKFGERRLVIEIQWSTLSLATILKRSEGYREWETPVLWILPLKKPLVGEFRPRSFERYLHHMYFGRVYYWQQGDGLLVTPMHFVPVERWIETREFPDSQGELCEGGGYAKKLHLIKTGKAGVRINIAEHFHPKQRDESIPPNEKRKVPRLLLWQDNLSTWWNEDREEAARKKWDEEDD